MTNPPYKYGDFTIPSHWFANGYKKGTDPDVFLRSARIWKLRAPDGRFFHEGYADCRAWWGDEAGADLYLYTDAKFMASKANVAGVVPFIVSDGLGDDSDIMPGSEFDGPVVL